MSRRGIELKGRRGIVLKYENKVNSFSNQLEFSWVCKLEWSLTITFDVMCCKYSTDLNF